MTDSGAIDRLFMLEAARPAALVHTGSGAIDEFFDLAQIAARESKQPARSGPGDALGDGSSAAAALHSDLESKLLPSQPEAAPKSGKLSSKPKPLALLFAADMVHGPTLSDHMQEKKRYSGYWDMRTSKLNEQQPSEALYGKLSAALVARGAGKPQPLREIQHKQLEFAPSFGSGTSAGSSSRTPPLSAGAGGAGAGAGAGAGPGTGAGAGAGSGSASESAAKIFAGLCVYFNGRSGEFSSLHLGHLFRVHGGATLPHLARKKLTHIVCSNLSLSKTEKALRSLGPRPGRRHVSLVKPAWITDSIAAGRRLPEHDYIVVRDPTATTLLPLSLPLASAGAASAAASSAPSAASAAATAAGVVAARVTGASGASGAASASASASEHTPMDSESEFDHDLGALVDML